MKGHDLASLSSLPKATQLAKELGLKLHQQMLQPCLSQPQSNSISPP